MPCRLLLRYTAQEFGTGKTTEVTQPYVLPMSNHDNPTHTSGKPQPGRVAA